MEQQCLPPLYQYYFRTLLGLLAIAALLGSEVTHYRQISLPSWLTALLLLAYYGLSYWRSLHVGNRSARARCWLALGDGWMIAIAVSQLDYTPWPSVVLIGLLQFIALQGGGGKQWLQVNAGLLTGLALGFFILDKQSISPHSHSTLNTLLLIAAFAYMCIYGVYSYSYQSQLVALNHSLQQDCNNFRQHAYKLSRYLPAPVTALLKGKDVHLKTERKRITVFFSDLVGFTELSEELEAETLTEMLNRYFSEMSKIANQFNGTVDKFMGDAIMVLFGDHEYNSQGVKKDAIQCVSMAIAMTKRMRELQPQWTELGIKKPLNIRIGINSGYCTVGTFGTSKNLDYTALGAHVNLASRLESAGKPGNILISHETWSLVKDVILCRDKGEIKAKGFSHPIHVYEVIDLRKDLGGNQSYFSENMQGFSMHLDLEKIKNYDKEKVIESLENATKKLKGKHIV
ncbi:MAG: adenylate/guanylate cyclase domain-containing protein [Cellvibrionaceae bacterium]|nr:adenylate/guanylate cyclase domain-containing protein [Cellvibrionaceae bacterium]